MNVVIVNCVVKQAVTDASERRESCTAEQGIDDEGTALKAMP
jgi:hypothetical protein